MTGGFNKRFLAGMAAFAIISVYTGISVFPDRTTDGSDPLADSNQFPSPSIAGDEPTAFDESRHSRSKIQDNLRSSPIKTATRSREKIDRRLKPKESQDQFDDSQYVAAPAPSELPPREEKLDMPDWSRIFNPGGSLKDELNENGRSGANGVPDYVDLYNGVEAEFIQETISNGLATDSSALLTAGNLSDEVLYNGPVRAAHDLGNAYVLTTIGSDKHLRIYAGAERLKSDGVTYIEFEFNQNPVRLSFGAPWPIVGERVQGDLIVRMIFSNQALQSVEIEEWQYDGFRLIESASGITATGCKSHPDFMYCVGDVPIVHPVEGFESWDDNNESLPPVFANDFVEIGIDVDRILGSNINYASILLRTPEDVALNSFNTFDPLAMQKGFRGLLNGEFLIDGP